MNASVENLIKAFTYQRFFTLFIKMKNSIKVFDFTRSALTLDVADVLNHYSNRYCSFLNCTHYSEQIRVDFSPYNLLSIFNLMDQNLVKQYLKVLALHFEDITAIFNTFHELFSFKKHQATFYRKNLNCSSNPIYLLSN